MKNAILKFIRDEQGATAVEYGMIAGLIAAAITVIVGKLVVEPSSSDMKAAADANSSDAAATAYSDSDSRRSD